MKALDLLETWADVKSTDKIIIYDNTDEMKEIFNDTYKGLLLDIIHGDYKLNVKVGLFWKIKDTITIFEKENV